MKFSELDDDTWAELQPFLDTALLPVSGLSGGETPAEAAEKIGRTGDWLSPLEASFRGRTVTLPASHYDGDPAGGAARLEALCASIKRQGYRHLIVVAGNGGWTEAQLPSADMILQPQAADEAPDPERIRQAVTALWKRSSGA
ncbi:DUF2487 family protein [Cohnella nanjingensis]|uniref:DUF2487 family protein n=1 Tax=Cohnella nanjingensis TaxID=1387779 RepID=A0A7X0RXX9_9BACL|nr:DUF2487 family protein [Cohnella nanjingensis]MBB6674119.1 DUF2487 family protein [Cohnella nanjingensis]